MGLTKTQTATTTIAQAEERQTQQQRCVVVAIDIIARCTNRGCSTNSFGHTYSIYVHIYIYTSVHVFKECNNVAVLTKAN